MVRSNTGMDITGEVIGLFGIALGTALGYFVAALIISPDGMMGTYLDMPDWSLSMPGFCIPVMAATLVFLILISFLSVKKMLKGTAADALRPYAPKAMKKSILEKLPFWEKLPFAVKWNVRDILRHKSRSAMTLIGVLIGLPAGVGVLQVLIIALASEYELSLTLGALTYSVSIIVTFGVSLVMGWMVARKNRRNDMVEALKDIE